jgi:putative endonuclease
MHYVYILETHDGQHWYTGLTTNIQRRLIQHNAGQSTHTSKYASWRLKTYIAFSDFDRAKAFESYLKTHSGRAFAMKRL